MKQLDKKVVWIFFANSFLGIVVFIPFMVFWVIAAANDIFGSEGPLTFENVTFWIVLGVLAFLLISFIWAKLTYHYYKYELTELGFRKESGVIYKKYVTIPYARIQNVDINRGILARLLGLSDLMIQTAGASASFNRYGVAGAGAEGRLPGVSKADAEILRDELIRRASRSMGQGM